MATQSQKQQEIAKKLANLTPEKRSAFIKLLKKEGIDPTKLPIIPTNRESKPTPLSWGQERLWFLDQFEENSTTYNLLLGVTINGTLDIGTLQKSLDTIIERHEVLRTNFQEIDGHAVQIIKPAATWPLTIENCPESEITKYIHQEQQKPFNLATDILVRATLLKISHSKYILLITRHHIVWDGWSTGIFLQELSTIYQSYIQGKNPNLTPLTIQYADFSQWQREWLTEEILAEQIKYWQENLKNAPSLLQLPTDKPRPSIMTFNGKNQQLIINQEIAEKLQLLSRETGTTLFMTLLAVFSTLLYRYSNQEDILIGSPIANRNKAEIEPLIGFFVNTLVLRTLFSENLTFTELLQQIKQTTLSAYNHQDVPFEQIVDAVKVERSLSHSPLFQVMFVLQNTPSETIKLPDVTLTPLTLEKETTNFDLTLDIEPSEQGLVANWEYNSDLFEDATITRMLGHFENILTSVLANPQQQVNQINLLTAAERNQLLYEWNDTKVDYPQNKCIHQLFEEQVNKTPDGVAVIFENQQLTYQELNEKANQLAHYLQQLGVKPETLVGICVERSLEMVIGLLGILKAGGAYVPIDPNYPSERIGYTISDSGVAILLTQTSLVTSLPKHQAEVICLDKDWEKIIKESKINPINTAKSENLAYVIYTSGSTGKPKGVLVNHANVMRLFTATEAWYNFNSTDVWTMFHSYAFDFSVWEIWGALIYGGRLVIVPYLISREPAAFYQLLSQEKVTILNQTPSAFRQLIQTEETQINNGKLTNELNLRFVIFGGEALELQSLKPWFDRHSDSSPKLVNMYGITETTVHVTYRPLTIADLNSNASVIGCPIPDLQVYLLDQYQQPVPIGVAGEMYVGGAGVTRGYLKRPKLNDQRFIADSFSNKKDARLYKSGDLARYLSNGDLQYLGRIDNQVKIRGFRIELGEIEAALTQYPDIRETIVITTENTSSDKQLVAYIVPQTEIQPSISDLRNFLKEQLPDYMIPSIFVTLDALPLTSNGKIDRRALPKPEINRGELEEVYQPPRTASEKVLAEIWGQILGLEKVGIHDNFFALGGDSIRTIQIQSLAREKGLNFSIQQMFQYQTIYELVQEIKPGETSYIISSEPFSLISPEDRKKIPNNIEDAYPMTSLQMGMIFHSEFTPDTTNYQSITSLHLQGQFHRKKLQIAIQNLAVRHPILRTSFDLSNFSQPLQLVYQQLEIPCDFQDISHLSSSQQEEVLETWFATEKQKKFSLVNKPLLRFTIHQRSERTFQFSFSEHHAILDGWSVASMITELLTNYFSLLNKENNNIQSPLKLTFRDFVALEQQAIANPEYQQYWQQKLNNSNIIKLPRCKNSQFQMKDNTFDKQVISISSEISAGLKRLSQQAKVPIKSILLAAHLRVLNLLSGQSDIITGLVTNGRPEQTDSEKVLGLFLNTLPLRMQLSGGSWLELVKEVFATEQELQPYSRYPLAEIQRNIGGHGLFETAFNFINFHVYDAIQEFKNLQILGQQFFEETNFTFVANFSLEPISSELVLTVQYNASELSNQQIEKMLSYYVSALTSLAKVPTEQYELNSLLSLTEEKQLLREYNHTQVEYPQDKCLHQLFTEQAEKTPEAIAIKFANQQLTYQELNQKANQLAHYLQQLGVKPETLVGICIERSLEMVIGLLGILKAGGAYVPIDPNYPTERIAYMLSDSNAQILLTESSLLPDFTEYQKPIICLDQDWHKINQESGENVNYKARPENLAYVIYTSGSTGKPKGVQIQHQGLVNFLTSMEKQPGLTEKDVFNAVTTICFDIAGLEIYLPLIVGAKVVITPREIATDGMRLLQQIQDDKITVMQATPATWQMLVTAGLNKEILKKNKINTIKMLCGGETLTTQLANQLLETGGELWNLYGPTETTIWSMVKQVEKTDAVAVIPIGKPIANTQIYILDSYLKPVPMGVAGELHIGGDGLARGYLNRPELTAERFINSPFSPHQKIYKTGDLARYLPDGNIEYLGRIDHQVKIRGFRIELGEIEAVINDYPQINQSVVIAKTDKLGNQNLVAYLLVKDGFELPQLKDVLKSKLPDYMIPTAFVVLESFPLTPNGKVDRKSLPEPEFNRENFQQSYQAPRTSTEVILSEIFSELLNINPVGVHDNFFDLGGHSLLAVRLMALIQDRFKVNLPLAILFQSPTVAELALLINNHINQNNINVASPILVPMQTKGNKPPLFFMPGAGGNVIYLHQFVQCLGQEIPVYGLQPKGLNGEEELDNSVEEIARTYIEAMKKVQPEGPYFIAGHSFGGYVAYEVGRQLQAQGETIGGIFEVDTLAPKKRKYQQPKNMAEWEWLAMMLQQAEDLYGQKIGIVKEDFSKITDDEQLYNYGLQLLINGGILPPGSSVKQLRGVMKVYKTNNDTKYVVNARKVAKLPIVLFRAKEELREESEIIQEEWFKKEDWGWSDYADKSFNVEWIPGDHHTMMASPNVEVLAQKMQNYLG